MGFFDNIGKKINKGLTKLVTGGFNNDIENGFKKIDPAQLDPKQLGNLLKKELIFLFTDLIKNWAEKTFKPLIDVAMQIKNDGEKMLEYILCYKDKIITLPYCFIFYVIHLFGEFLYWFCRLVLLILNSAGVNLMPIFDISMKGIHQFDDYLYYFINLRFMYPFSNKINSICYACGANSKDQTLDNKSEFQKQINYGMDYTRSTIKGYSGDITSEIKNIYQYNL